MSVLAHALEELVTANRILAREGIVDAFGHASIRHPDMPGRYLLSRARAPECVNVDDLMEFTLDGIPVDARGRKPYAERFIHGALYEARDGTSPRAYNGSWSFGNDGPYGGDLDSTEVRFRRMRAEDHHPR